MYKPTKIARFIGLAGVAAAVILVLTTQPASADDVRSIASEHHYRTNQDTFRFLVRTGAGSLFGPGMKTGQPNYARDAMFDPTNQKPFSPLHQAGMTYGVAATGEIATHDKWAFGVTGLVGFNATTAKRGGLASDLETKEKLQGPSYGGGLRASYGNNNHRAAIDVVYTQTRLKGSVQWTVEDMFSPSFSNEARYEYDLGRFAAMLGYEFTMGGPFFGFVQGGVQYLPQQKSKLRQQGSVPWAVDGAAFQSDFSSQELRQMNREVTFDPELQYALGTGIGVRF